MARTPGLGSYRPTTGKQLAPKDINDGPYLNVRSHVWELCYTYCI